MFNRMHFILELILTELTESSPALTRGLALFNK